MRIIIYNRTKSPLDLGEHIPKLNPSANTSWDVNVLTLAQSAVLDEHQSKRNIDYYTIDNPNEPADLEVARSIDVTSVDASGVTFTPAVLADWDASADPGDLDAGVNQLASRTTALEGAGGGGGFTAWTETVDSGIFNNDGTLEDLIFAIPAGVKLLVINSFEVSLIGGTFVPGFANLSLNSYIDAGLSVVGNFQPFVNPLPVGVQLDGTVEVMQPTPKYAIGLQDNSFDGTTVQYRVTLTGYTMS